MGKLKKEKHNHKLTDFLKVGIFSLVMLAPFISIGSKMAYVAFNKNAYESYYGDTINDHEFIYVDDYTDFKVNTLYWFNTINNVTNISNTYGGSSVKLYINNVNIQNVLNSNISYVTFYHDATRNYFDLHFRDSEGNVIVNYATNNPIVNEINFEYVSYHSDTTILNTFLQDMYIHNIEYNNYSYLDNVFEYAVDQLGTTPIFAWTKNTAIYTPIETMTNGLGFDPDNNTLAILLTYWSLVTAVYVIMDIILFAFTKITHFTQD